MRNEDMDIHEEDDRKDREEPHPNCNVLRQLSQRNEIGTGI